MAVILCSKAVCFPGPNAAAAPVKQAITRVRVLKLARSGKKEVQEASHRQHPKMIEHQAASPVHQFNYAKMPIQGCLRSGALLESSGRSH